MNKIKIKKGLNAFMMLGLTGFYVADNLTGCFTMGVIALILLFKELKEISK